MKSASASLIAHLEKRVTTLASCWEITRQDGTIHRFTDLDINLVFGGNTYEAQGGFSRSQITSKADMSVDNLQVQGFLDSATLTADLIRTGKLDSAAVRLFLVNYLDADTDGDLKLRRGQVGEMRIRDQDVYEIELRGLSQRLSQQILRPATPACPVDLFSPECALVAANFRETGVVDTVTDRRIFTVPSGFTINMSPTQAAPSLQFSAATDRQGVLVVDETVQAAQAPAEDGSPQFPILVGTPAELDDIRNNLNAHYALSADIDMGAFGLFTPIPTFLGTLDGRGYRIQNLDLDHSAAPQNAGLFAAISGGAVLKRIGLDAPTIRSGNATTWAGGLVADNTASGGGLIEDCYVVAGSLETDGNQAGPLVGRAGDATVRRCWAATPVTGAIGANAGGFMGNAGTVSTNCFFDEDAAGTSVDGGGSVAATAVSTLGLATSTTLTGFDQLNTWRSPGVSGVSATFVNSNPDTITRSTGSWLDEGFRVGSRIAITGTTSNNTGSGVTHLVTGVTATTLTLDAAVALTGEGPVSCTILAYPRIMDPGRC